MKDEVEFAKLFLVRHGETAAKTNDLANGGPLVSGRLDTPLTENGKKSMIETGKNYKNIAFDAVFVSPLARSHDSAQAFLEGAEQSHLIPIVDPDLIEINYGIHEGMPVTEVAQQKKEYFAAHPQDNNNFDFAFPGQHPIFGSAESFKKGALRFKAALTRIAGEYQGKNILIVSHSGIMRALQLTGEVENRGVTVGGDVPFGDMLILKSDGHMLELDQ
ncbi:MAG: phosphoglycerate mutase [Candidatus Kaiserbacteria bacterium]|nr:phosphoglycerate mutase [Candidatus Kaiserbacteria bacterium]